MELKIRITPKNVQQIAKLLPLLVAEEGEELDLDEKLEAHGPEESVEMEEDTGCFAIPSRIEGLDSGKAIVDEQTNAVGSWGQFNSYFPIKALLRAIANLMIVQESDSVDLNEVVNLCRDEFKRRGFSKYRGFPNSDKPSSIGRFVWHFISTAHEMGLINVEGIDEGDIPLYDWVGTAVSITKEGYDFAVIRNGILDDNKDVQILTAKERDWILRFLKRIDKQGHKEFSFISRLYQSLKDGKDPKASLEGDEDFKDYIRTWSRKTESPRALNKQISNVATTFASSKIAILRELGVVSNKRGDYSVISNL